MRLEPPSGRWAAGLLVLAAVSGAVGWTVRGPARPHPAVVPAGPTGGGWEGLLGGVPLDLNRATPEDLTAVPGIGPVRAAQIVAERNRRGGFGSVDELVEVRGIGPKTLAAVRPYLCLTSPREPGDAELRSNRELSQSGARDLPPAGREAGH